MENYELTVANVGYNQIFFLPLILGGGEILGKMFAMD